MGVLKKLTALSRFKIVRHCGGLLSLCLLVASTPTYGSPALPSDAGAQPGQASGEFLHHESVPLVPGIPFEDRLADGEDKVFRLNLPADGYLRIAIEPRAIDLDVRLRAPGGDLLAEVESRTGRPSPHFLAALTPVAGSYELTVRASSKLPGAHDFAVVLAELRPAGSGDAMRAEAAHRLSEGFRLSEEGCRAASEAALEHFEAMLDLYQELADPAGQATAYYWIGLLLRDLRRHKETLEPLAQALELWRGPERRDQQAEIHYWLGIIHHESGRLDEAQGSFHQALDLSQEIGDRQREARIRSRLSAVSRERNQLQRALDHSRRAWKLFGQLGRPRHEAKELCNLTAIYQRLGELDPSFTQLDEALRVLQQVGDRRNQALALNNIAWSHRKQGEPQKALEEFEQALRIAVEHGKAADQATILNNTGRTRLDLGDPERALSDIKRALELSRRHGRQRGEIVCLISLGAAWQALGDYEQATASFEEALALSRRHEFRNEEAGALYELARSHRQQSWPAKALREVEEALAIVEEVRTDLDSHNLKASFRAYRSPYHELRVDLLMQRARASPEAGFESKALAAHEQARARSLLETLAEADTEIRAEAPPELLEEERQLHESLNAQALRRSRLLADGGQPRELAVVDQEIRRLRNRIEEVAGRIRDASPRYAALVHPPPLDLGEIRSRVLDDDSVLLEYALGEERSFLWIVTTSSLEAFVLPSRARIEEAARSVFELLSDGEAWRGTDSWPHHRAYRQAARDLSELVLAPAAHRLARRRRLLVVADGALQYIPFAALPAPPTEAGFKELVTEHEIVSLPSASIVALLRRERAGAPPASRRLAILADPVYQASDVRLGQSSGPSPGSPDSDPDLVRRSARDCGLEQYQRLPGSGREANAIVELLPEGASHLALGFDANRRFATRELGGYHWLHFAAHGCLNSRTPELSGIVLSLRDRHGRLQDGFLRLHDLYNLRLDADLVVLSACQTALGKEIRGEGLIGLTRGFLHAGARRVVASLWQVEDEATAAFMERFYRGMVQEDLGPAAALRRAQNEMLRSPRRRWRAPYFWAAFSLQGEWR
ncbi:MAG: CHAT domain-containing protein [bacterium]|nr:CHAT domain-containing protein [bacterium]